MTIEQKNYLSEIHRTAREIVSMIDAPYWQSDAVRRKELIRTKAQRIQDLAVNLQTPESPDFEDLK